jgi:hypothetical protein
MPYVAKLITKPKLSGGFNWVVGVYYIVRKNEDSKTVSVISVYNDKITITQNQARELFTKPEWFDSFDLDTMQALAQALADRDIIREKEKDKPKVSWKI